MLRMSRTAQPLEIPLCRTILEAATEIRRQSFALFVMSEATESVHKARQTASLFFKESQINPKLYLQRYRQIHNSTLFGFNCPSPAKLLFRAWCENNQMPWPNDGMKVDSQNVAKVLHKILVECLRCIAKNVPEKFVECPLDYFYYYALGSIENCSPHVDRGALICVALSETPGLEVRLANGEFVCVEEQNIPNKDILCIMAGDQLLELIPQQEIIPACIHRVKRNLDAPRLSITYELRL